MAYLIDSESEKRLAAVRALLAEHHLDLALIYYDEFNIGNGWYLTGWCPQFESGAVLVPREGAPLLLGGPESEPFAKQDSAIKNTRNFPVFMVPDEEYPNAEIIDFPHLFAELNRTLGSVKRVGLVGAERMPVASYHGIAAGFSGVELVDITDDFLRLRHHKSAWEAEQVGKAFTLADAAFDAMTGAVKVGATEIEVAAAGEYAARSRGASGFGFSAIVGSGKRANEVVPTASSKVLADGELVMLGLAPKWRGYAGVFGDTVPANGVYTAKQKDCINHLREVFRLTKAMLQVGRSGREIDVPGRKYFAAHGLLPYLVCPFAHTIGLLEAEAPFFGPNSDDVLTPGMTVCVDISFFGHPEFNGARIETGYLITEAGPKPFSPRLDALHTSELQ